MANFSGTWVTDHSSVVPAQQEKMIDALGLSDKKELLLGSTTTYKVQVTGKQWKIESELDRAPGKKQTYEFEAGQKFSSKGLDGVPFEMLVTVESDNKVTEESRRQVTTGKWIEYKINREINGNVMSIKSVCGDAVFEHKMTKK